MANKIIFSFITIILINTYLISASLGVNIPIPSNNSALNVNDSYYWQGYTPDSYNATYITPFQSLVEDLYVDVTGDHMTGSLNMQDAINMNRTCIATAGNTECRSHPLQLFGSYWAIVAPQYFNFSIKAGMATATTPAGIITSPNGSDTIIIRNDGVYLGGNLFSDVWNGRTYGNYISMNQNNITYQTGGSAELHTFKRSTNAPDFIIDGSGNGNFTKNLYVSGDIYTADDLFVADSVGIGTTAPNDLLHIFGSSANLLIQTNDFNQGAIGSLLFKTSTDINDNFYKGGIIFEDNGLPNARGDLHIVNDGASDSGNAGVEDAKVTILSTGNVGIGTTSPKTKLDVNGTFNVSGGNDAYFSDDLFVADDTTLSGSLSLGDVISNIVINKNDPYLTLNDTGGLRTQIDVKNEGGAFTIYDTENAHIAFRYYHSLNYSVFDTNSGVIPLWISRFGTDDEGLKIYSSDNSVYLLSEQDENTIGYGNMIFQVDNDNTADGKFVFEKKDGNDLLIINQTTDIFNIRDSVSTTNLIMGGDGISNSNNARITTLSGDSLSIGTEYLDAIKIDTSQNVNITGDGYVGDDLFVADRVGIGTTAPGSKLHVAIGAASNSIKITGKADNSVDGILGYNNASGAYLWLEDESGSAESIIRSYGVSYFNGGNVGIGTTAPTHKLNVVGDLNVTGNLVVNNATGITDTTSYWFCTSADCASTCQVNIQRGLITGCT